MTSRTLGHGTEKIADEWTKRAHNRGKLTKKVDSKPAGIDEMMLSGKVRSSQTSSPSTTQAKFDALGTERMRKLIARRISCVHSKRSHQSEIDTIFYFNCHFLTTSDNRTRRTYLLN